MKSLFLTLALVLSVLCLDGLRVASAASVSPMDGIASTVAGDSSVVEVQGYGGGGYDGGYRRRGYDDDDDRGSRRYREREYDSRREYCWRCRRRCDDGFCPPRCWGWRRHCRWDRY